LKFTGKEFVVIVTRGHQYDADVLGDTLKKQTRYVGMIGSKEK
jgi:xanthine dehydrogenase accessory factor